jgi:ubiquitin carboxyl-terminal hydrolase 5/13
VPLPEEEAAKLGSRPEKLAIGGEGGFQLDADRFTLQKDFSLAVLPEMLTVPLPCPDLPELVLGAIQGVQVRAHSRHALKWGLVVL